PPSADEPPPPSGASPGVESPLLHATTVAPKATKPIEPIRSFEKSTASSSLLFVEGGVGGSTHAVQYPRIGSRDVVPVLAVDRHAVAFVEIAGAGVFVIVDERPVIIAAGVPRSRGARAFAKGVPRRGLANARPVLEIGPVNGKAVGG